MAGPDGWTLNELRATVVAYREMLALEEAGKPYSKAQYRRDLRAGPLAARSEASIEYRMQNISAALQELCLPWIEGYKPAANIGNNIKDQIHALLREEGVVEAELAQPTAAPDVLEARTSRLRERRGLSLLDGKPRGQLTPRRVAGASTQFVRDPLVRAWVLEATGGRCEACHTDAPFADSAGQPYLEVHHMVTLAEGGPDTVDNAVGLCPNCHRWLHLGHDRDEVKAGLYVLVKRLRGAWSSP
jgi:5-methylcytosine-specific restriction enzyme A